MLIDLKLRESNHYLKVVCENSPAYTIIARDEKNQPATMNAIHRHERKYSSQYVEIIVTREVPMIKSVENGIARLNK